MLASAHFHEFFIQPTDAVGGEKTDAAAAEPAVQEEQEEEHVSVKDGRHVWELLLTSTHGGAVGPLHSNISYFDKTQTCKGGEQPVHVFFIVHVECNHFFLHREGNVLHLDQMPVNCTDYQVWEYSLDNC